MRLALLLPFLTAACSSSSADSSDVAHALATRYAGDRTGACIAAAVIDGDQVQRSSICADPAHARSLDGAFEIGSVSKTMTASLLADLIDQGKIALTDPIAKYLPAGTQIPTFNGAPILIEHLVTHTSGLPRQPSRITATRPDDPYAQLDPATLIASLADVTLPQAPGAKWAYSNFGVMLLSYIVSTVAGSDYETVARTRLFEPLAMKRTYLAHAPAGVTALPGHSSTGEQVAAWSFTPDLGGVGGVRSTLDDMIRYAQAGLGIGDAHTVAILERTHATVDLGMPRPAGDPEMGMGWIRIPYQGRTLLAHDGGTGGFVSFVMLDPGADRAVVALSDTQLDSIGGLGELALHLLDPAQPLSGPRTIATPTAALLAALAGHYQLGDLDVTLSVNAGALVGALADGPSLTFEYDSHGDFFTHEVDAVLTPMLDDKGQQTFAWNQGGEATAATRL